MIVSLKNRRRIYGIEHGRKARNLDKPTRIETLLWFPKIQSLSYRHLYLI